MTTKPVSPDAGESEAPKCSRCGASAIRGRVWSWICPSDRRPTAPQTETETPLFTMPPAICIDCDGDSLCDRCRGLLAVQTHPEPITTEAGGRAEAITASVLRFLIEDGDAVHAECPVRECELFGVIEEALYATAPVSPATVTSGERDEALAKLAQRWRETSDRKRWIAFAANEKNAAVIAANCRLADAYRICADELTAILTAAKERG